MERIPLSNEPAGLTRVLRVITQLSRGGVEAKLASLLPLLRDRGFDVAVCCIKEAGSLAGRLAQAGARVHVCRVRSRLDPVGIFGLARFIRRQQTDIVHTHMYAANITGTLAARLAGAPVIISNVHNVGKFRTRRQVIQDRFVARFRDATVCVSERVKQDYLEATGLSGRDIVVIYNGVDTERFRPRELWRAGKRSPSSEVRAQLGIGDDEQLVVAAGRLIPQKRPELLLSAFAIVHESQPGTRLLVLGSGELHDSLVELSRKLGIAHAVIFAGYRKDVAECLAASDVFVSSSAKEGFSNVLLEALATGLPAVVTDVGGNREAVRDGQEGFLCEPCAEGLAERVVRILTDAELRKEMSRNARSRAMEFGLERMADQTAALYERLLSRGIERASDG
ncbi:MAG TPA: glycosyltransferase [bacterium]|nr:glycosyltransferase [bacterium]